MKCYLIGIWINLRVKISFFVINNIKIEGENMVAVIYARYSDSKQREESIEAQLKICHAYAESKGYTVVREYIDRALTGRSDDRPQFQLMIRDSAKKQFEKVIVYRLDRFSRGVYDPAIYKSKLLENGVKVESATENIPDNSLGIIIESLINGTNASYSVELAEKVKRNLDLNAEKCLSNGGTTPLGYKLERINPREEKSKKKYVINEKTAPIVQEVFTKYANGWSVKAICDSLNERGLKTAQGAAFNRSSLHTMLSNRKYLGIYIYDGKEIPGGMPQIIDEDLFNQVAEKMKLNKKNPGRTRAKAEYILTTKLFCGYCKEKMVGHSSNQISKKGVIFNYYKCKNSGGSKPCKKKMVHKDYIEDVVINECIKLLNPKNIARIAKEVVKIAESFDDYSELNRLKRFLQKAQDEKENHMVSLRACKDDIVRDMIFEDLGRIGSEIKELEKQIEVENARHYVVSEQQVVEHLTRLSQGNINDITYRKSLIRLFVNKIFLYDDKFTITFNTGDEEVTITDVLLEKIESSCGVKKLCLLNNVVHHSRIPKLLSSGFFFLYNYTSSKRRAWRGIVVHPKISKMSI